MDNLLKAFIFSGILFLALCASPSQAQTCNSQSFSRNQVYSTCVDLPALSSFLHWNFNQGNNTADIAFRKTGTTTSSWVCWALNPAGGRTGATTAAGGSNSRLRKRNVHGVLNAVSWGILLPLGAIIARYMKVFKAANPAWFYLHVACQLSAYIVGVAGWGTGLKLGSDSVGVEYNKHRNIGITLFCFGTLQMFALLLRPKPDHKYRLYWNMYHYAIGYATISLSIVNVYEGLDILDPAKKWKTAYTVIIIVLGAIALVLEAITWLIVIKRKQAVNSADKYANGGANGANGHGHRTHQEA
ncbi:Cytochrome b561 and DOMON domain-containing protein At5g47530 [Linum perenne]